MRSIFTIGIQHPNRTFLGQWENVISAAINAGVQAYRIHSEEERAEEEQESKERISQQAAAREQEALRIQQESLRALQQQQAPVPVTRPSGETILGMQPGTFYTIAGVTAGALLLGGFLLTRGK